MEVRGFNKELVFKILLKLLKTKTKRRINEKNSSMGVCICFNTCDDDG